jgi:hypothetical protein
MDESPFLEALKNFKRAVGQDMTVPCETGNFAHFTIFISFMINGATLSKSVQYTLLVLRYIQWINSILREKTTTTSPSEKLWRCVGFKCSYGLELAAYRNL